MSTYPGLARLALFLIGAAGPLVAADSGALEFRGAVKEGDVWWVNLHRPGANVSPWVAVGTEGAGVSVRSYDDGTNQLTVIREGHTLVLPLKRYRVSLSGPTAPLKLLDPGERVSAAEAPDMPDFLRELPPEARRLLAEVHRRPAIRWPATAGSAPAKPQ
jgi:hypothetical protein